MKKAISLLLLAAFITTASAFEIKGSVSSLTAGNTASIKTIDINETGNTSIGLKLPLDFNKNTNLNIAGDFSFLWKVNSETPDFIVDCTELNLLMSIPLTDDSYGSFEMGRFSVKDATELIFKQNLDGVRFLVEAPKIKAHLYGGYTGLLNGHHNPMLPTLNYSGLYPTAPTFITADLYAYMPDVYEDKSIGLEVLGVFNAAAATQNKIYAIARIDGKFLYFIPYTLCSAFSWSNENNVFGHMANLSFASIEYTINSFHFGGKAVYASGNTGNFSTFKQLSVIYADKGSTLLYSNLVKMGLFFDRTAENKVKIAFDSYIFMNFTEGSEVALNGVQWGLNIEIPFISKSKLVFDLGQLIPITTGTFNTNLSMFLSFGF